VECERIVFLDMKTSIPPGSSNAQLFKGSLKSHSLQELNF